MNKEDTILLKRFEDLSRTAYQRGINIYTGFLSLYEQNLLINHAAAGMLSCRFTLLGGYEYAERKMACFYDDSILLGDNPISVILVKPLNNRFAEELTHRDYLGALMNLGIEREVIGDIITAVSDTTTDTCNKSTYIICKSSMADYITENYNTVKHTRINCTLISAAEELKTLTIRPEFEEIVGSVSSLRLDCILSLAFNKSRTQLSEYIKAGAVFVNGRLTESTSFQLSDGDVVSMRGFGKFIFDSTGGQSKKGKTYIKLLKYT